MRRAERFHAENHLISVSRAPDRARFEIHPMTLAEPLPRFRVPLKPADPDVAPDLQAAFDRACDSGGHADFVDDSQPPPFRSQVMSRSG